MIIVRKISRIYNSIDYRPIQLKMQYKAKQMSSIRIQNPYQEKIPYYKYKKIFYQAT